MVNSKRNIIIKWFVQEIIERCQLEMIMRQKYLLESLNEIN